MWCRGDISIACFTVRSGAVRANAARLGAVPLGPARLAVMGFAIGLLTLTGCQSSPFAGRDHLPYPAVPDRHTSVVLPPAPLAQAQADAQAQGVQWYDYRNDQQPSTLAGYFGPTYERQVTWSYDRQSTSNGRAQDYSNTSTYRVQWHEQVR